MHVHTVKYLPYKTVWSIVTKSLFPFSHVVTDIARVDSFGYKACQKDEVQNCVLLTGAAYALQEDVQG